MPAKADSRTSSGKKFHYFIVIRTHKVIQQDSFTLFCCKLLYCLASSLSDTGIVMLQTQSRITSLGYVSFIPQIFSSSLKTQNGRSRLERLVIILLWSFKVHLMTIFIKASKWQVIVSSKEDTSYFHLRRKLVYINTLKNSVYTLHIKQKLAQNTWFVRAWKCILKFDLA